jgi:hypothetical protein
MPKCRRFLKAPPKFNGVRAALRVVNLDTVDELSFGRLSLLPGEGAGGVPGSAAGRPQFVSCPHSSKPTAQHPDDALFRVAAS